jgi:hypothetical protein
MAKAHDAKHASEGETLVRGSGLLFKAKLKAFEVLLKIKKWNLDGACVRRYLRPKPPAWFLSLGGAIFTTPCLRAPSRGSRLVASRRSPQPPIAFPNGTGVAGKLSASSRLDPGRKLAHKHARARPGGWAGREGTPPPRRQPFGASCSSTGMGGRPCWLGR